MQKKYRIIFAGTPEFSVPALKALIDAGHDVCAVYTQPDRPAGRGQKLQHSPVKECALEHGIPVFQPTTLKQPEDQETLASHQADLMVVVAYGLLLPKAVLETPPLGCLNIHASLLPRWRGAAPIHRAVMAGDQQTGITIMQMDEGLDTGDMLLTRHCDIGTTQTSGQLHDQLMQLGGEAIVAALRDLPHLQEQAQPQSDDQACYAAKLHKDEAEINWNADAQSLQRQVLGLNPWPVAQCLFSGKPLRVFDAEAIPDLHKAPPGTILESKDRLIISCGKNALSLLEVQMAGKKRMPIQAFLSGRQLPVGSSLAGE